VFDERAEAADPHRQRHAVEIAERARQLEQHQRVLQADGVHALSGAQRGELRLFLGVFAGRTDRSVRSEAAEADTDRLAADRVGTQFTGAAGLRAIDAFGLVADQRLERRPETLHQRHPLLFAARYRIELVFQTRGKFVIHVLRKMRAQEPRHRTADVGRVETAAFQRHVLPVLQGLDDAGVGRWPADAIFFQRLDQAGFGKTRRRLGEMLIGVDALQRDAVADLHRRQFAAFVLVIGTARVLALLVHGKKTRIDDRGARRAKAVRIAGGKFDADCVERGRHHLRGDGAFPDQLVQAAAIVIEKARHAGRRAQGRGRPDRFMRFLRVLGFGLVFVGRIGHRAGTEVARDHIAQLGHRLVGQADRIGTHVADQADRALVAQGDTLVQLLRHAHGARGGKAEFACGFLLQCRGDERRRRPALALLALDIADPQFAGGGLDHTRARRFGGLAVGDRELLELGAVQAHQTGRERLPGMLAFGLHRPVLASDERLDFFLALDNQAQRRRLHPPGRQAALHFAPQHRRQVEADQIVERTPRLLRIDQIGADLARVGDRLADRTRGDFGKHHPVQHLAFQQTALAQDLDDMPGNGLAFAIRVSGQVQCLGTLGRLGDGIDVLDALFAERVVHGEIVLGIDRAFFRNQVADVAIGGQHLELLAEVFVDRLGLGRRFDDEQIFGHGWQAPQAHIIRPASELARHNRNWLTAGHRPAAGEEDSFFSEHTACTMCQAPSAGDSLKSDVGWGEPATERSEGIARAASAVAKRPNPSACAAMRQIPRVPSRKRRAPSQH